MKMYIDENYYLDLDGSFLNVLRYKADNSKGVSYAIGTSTLDNLELAARIIVKDKLKNKQKTTQNYINELSTTLNRIREVVEIERPRT